MVLADTLNQFRPVEVVASVPDTTKLRKLKEKIERKADGLESGASLEPLRVKESIELVVSGNGRRRDLKIVASAGLDDLSQHPHAKQVVPQFLKQVEALGGTVLGALLAGYLMAPSHEGWVWRTVEQILQANQDRLPTRKALLVKRFRLLDEKRGQFFVGLASQVPLEQVERLFEDAGLKGLKATGFVAKSIFKQVCEVTRRSHSENDALERFFRLITTDAGIRFSNDVANYASALLSPYLTASPDHETERRIRNFLIEEVGDPRVNPGRWMGVDDDLINVFKRWLAADSIGMLFRIVERSNNTAHWAERQPFWQHYFDAELVTDAWVALGKNAAREARALKRSGVLDSSAQFGVISGGTMQANHSVLILRIGHLIITEWTHDGKVRFYTDTNKRRPKFYQNSYSADRIRDDFGADEFYSHYKGWQFNVVKYIQRQTGAIIRYRG